jgi:hypothetical protein
MDKKFHHNKIKSNFLLMWLPIKTKKIKMLLRTIAFVQLLVAKSVFAQKVFVKHMVVVADVWWMDVNVVAKVKVFVFAMVVENVVPTMDAPKLLNQMAYVKHMVVA